MKKEKKYLTKSSIYKKKGFTTHYLNRSSEEVINFDNVLSKIING